MPDKVTLPKEIANIIEKYRSKDFSNWMILYEMFEDAINEIPCGNGANLVEYVSDTDIDNLLDALVNGYEVEQTKEDKVREYFNVLGDKCAWGAEDAVCEVLDLLEIKIGGVND